MSDVKYLSNGQEVEVLETTPSGVIVRCFYDRHDEEAGSYDFDPIVVPCVYDEPPVARFAESVTKLESQLDSLRNQVALERALLANMKADRDAFKKLVTTTNNTEALKRISDFINGKITHFVVDGEYGDIRIVEYAEQMRQSCYDGKATRLLCLFGDSKGDLQWRINKWGDGSGGYSMVMPYTSREEAMQAAGELLSEAYESGKWLKAAVASAKKLGIAVPDDVMVTLAAEEDAAHEAELERAKARYEAAVAEHQKYVSSKKAGNT